MEAEDFQHRAAHPFGIHRVNRERKDIMERKNDQKTEMLLRELAEKMEALYEEQTCRMRVMESVQLLLERTA